MTHKLKTLLAERIATGLRRQSITDCAKWAEEYREMGQPFPGKWSFDHHPWLYGMHKAESDLLVGQKAAQMGYTEWAMNKSFYAIDVNGYSVLYVLPASKPDATDFSTGRFNPALENSPHLQKLFTDVKNIHHKRAGFANLYIRGSRSRSQLKSIPVAIIILDELDEMRQENIPLVFERMSGQIFKQIGMISTPTIENFGINYYFKQTTMEHYFFRCEYCSKLTELIFPDCLIITAENITDPNIKNSHLICKECKHKLPHETKATWLGINNTQWVPEHTDRLNRGFYINQMYSMTIHPYELAIAYLKAQIDAASEQEFYNSKLGLPHTVEGAKITDKLLDNCTGDYKMWLRGAPNMLVTMGVDVGPKWIHYEVDQWTFDKNSQVPDINIQAKCKILRVGTVQHFEELDSLMLQYLVRYAVIDANPERRKAFEFASRFYGHVRLCFYGKGINGKQVQLGNDSELTMSVDRTSWLDMSLGRFQTGTISIPQDTPLDYREHLKAPTRIYKKDKDGNPVGMYVTGNEDDHYAHARNYSEIALSQAMCFGQNKNITEDV